ncbi:GTP pyrophosphokinase [Butyrivibrio sp. LC3010]|uniref:GTP pyrophosphokinase n=1 Tax=Butyrivibrio sp. LC3010 TaxID=1280680 RepID=UPI000427DEA4|nr:hypothetical protein [Butyrivibrio sp. LC3010]
MNFGLQIQKQNYDELVPQFAQVQKIAGELLEKGLEEAKINIMQIPSRIKSWESIEDKLVKKQDKYSKVEDLTDILGLRIICYFLSQVDESAKVVHRLFDVDSDKSSDKREEISPSSFGYISLHMICSLKKDAGYPENLTELKFEIQLKTILQHAWAEIEHDLGYKTVLEIPNNMRRDFARIAGLLEVADDYFENLKNNLKEYELKMLKKIQADRADELSLDILTLNAFMQYSNAMRGLYDDMTALTGGKLIEVGAEDYLQMLNYMKLEKLGDIHSLIRSEHDHVLILLKHALKYSDLEEITSNAALFYLCRAKMVWGDYNEKEIRDIYYNYTEDYEKAEHHAEMILSLRKELRAVYEA